MASSFPTAKDVLENPGVGAKLNTTPHKLQHSKANDAIEALQDKVGIDDSTDETTLDYKVRVVGTAVNALGVTVAGYTATIATHTSQIATNTSDIATANGTIATHTSQIGTHTTDISTANGNISTLTTKVGYFSGRNVVVNGDMNIWQQGPGPFTTNNTYAADQCIFNAISGSTVSITKETLGITDPFPYAMQIAATTGSSAAGGVVVVMLIENVKQLAGERCTLSFYAKASASGKYVSSEIVQDFGAGGSPSSAVTGTAATKHSLTTSLARYTVTFDMPSLSGKTMGTSGTDSIRIAFWVDAGSNFNARTASLGNQTATVSITGVQLERGATATPFEYVDPATQLLRCQRYFIRIGGATTGDILGTGRTYSTTGAQVVIHFPVSMRAAPSLANGTVGSVSVNDNGGVQACTAITSTGLTTRTAISLDLTVASGLTANRPVLVYASATSGYFDFSARFV